MAFVDLKRQIVHRQKIAVVLCQVLDLDHGGTSSLVILGLRTAAARALLSIIRRPKPDLKKRGGLKKYVPLPRSDTERGQSTKKRTSKKLVRSDCR